MNDNNVEIQNIGVLPQSINDKPPQKSFILRRLLENQQAYQQLIDHIQHAEFTQEQISLLQSFAQYVGNENTLQVDHVTIGDIYNIADAIRSLFPAKYQHHSQYTPAQAQEDPRNSSFIFPTTPERPERPLSQICRHTDAFGAVRIYVGPVTIELFDHDNPQGMVIDFSTLIGKNSPHDVQELIMSIYDKLRVLGVHKRSREEDLSRFNQELQNFELGE
jgi:hypothetical protein